MSTSLFHSCLHFLQWANKVTSQLKAVLLKFYINWLVETPQIGDGQLFGAFFFFPLRDWVDGGKKNR